MGTCASAPSATMATESPGPPPPSSPSRPRSETSTLELQTLRQQADALRIEISKVSAALSVSSPPVQRVRTSTLEDGKVVRINENELAAMRQIFSLFDKYKLGQISASNLIDLHAKLGEPISGEEALAAVKQIGSGRDVITFDEFVSFWDGTHPSQLVPASTGTSSGDEEQEQRILQAERKRQWYQARFKFMKAKLGSPAVGRITTRKTGAPSTTEYRVHFETTDDSGATHEISPWHDVPYMNEDGSFNMIVEIPRFSRAKYEIATGEPFNPIKQDTRNGILRFYQYGDMLFNYGAISQTWENPKVFHPDTGSYGDNDPIDVIDLGSKMWGCGSIVAVKVLGVLGLIDAGETDWKLIAINISDPLAPLLNDIEDVYVHMPGTVEALTTWLRLYKTPLINRFAFEPKDAAGNPTGPPVPQNRAYALQILKETHEEWEKLVEARGPQAYFSPKSPLASSTASPALSPIELKLDGSNSSSNSSSSSHA